MRLSPTFAHPLAAVSAALLLALAAGCSPSAEPGSPSAAPAAKASPGQTASKLGDMTALRSIASEVAVLVDRGDLPAATSRIKDLEIAWDSAEAGLKPRAANDWHVLDKAIDQALAALREHAAHPADCKAAMANLLRTFDALQGKI